MQTIGMQTIDAGRGDLTHLDDLCQTIHRSLVPPEADLRHRICLLREVAHLCTIQHTTLHCKPDRR